MKTLLVRAAHADRPVPLEGQRKRCVTADKAVTVPDNYYYRKQMADGDLVEVSS